MKSDTARKVSLALVVTLMSALMGAQAGGAKDFGQRSVSGAEGTVQPQAGAKDFGHR